MKRRAKVLGAQLILLLLAFASLGHAFRPQAADHQLLVAAAISLKEAFNEIGGLYKQRTRTDVTFSLGASGSEMTSLTIRYRLAGSALTTR